MDDGHTDNICRVCRSEGGPERPLYYPCVCTGSIKYIHQECLVQWLKYSKKEYCELCKHRFAFIPIYSPDMPKRLPIKDIISGLLKSVARAVTYWLHYTLVAVAWLGIVPLTACRIYRSLFKSSLTSLLTLPIDIFSTDNLAADCLHGCFVVTCTLCTFIGLVWLREQILHGGGPDWLEHAHHAANQQQNVVVGDALVEGGEAPVGGAGDGPAAGAVDEGGVEREEGEEQEEEEGGQVEEAQEGNNPVQEDNWNPIDWERAAEELTWERLLGLDGSLVFLEHVFWVVSLNTLFILVFAFFPYHVGHLIILGFKAEQMISATQFNGVLTTLVGYFLIALCLIMMHTMATVAALNRTKRLLGICYVVVKVSLLIIVEIGLFPLICGWWLDICSLNMFEALMAERRKSFLFAPGTFMFIRWLVGMVYVFYFASFILLLREVLRPGVLWFLRSLNDPDFNPIQEMIHLPIYRHVRRFLASMVIFGTTVLLMLWLPVQLIRYLFPKFLPYNVMMSNDAPVSELSLELLLLQVVLPALLEQGHTRHWLKSVVRGWCVGVAWLLGLRSYLLGDLPLNQDGAVVVEEEEGEAGRGDARHPVPPAPPAADGLHLPQLDEEEVEEEEEGEEEEEEEEGEGEEQEEEEEEEGVGDVPAAAPPPPGGVLQGLGAAHQAMLHGGGELTGFQPYNMPPFFHLRLQMLLFFICWTLFIASFISLMLPVYVGRRLMSLWMGTARVHELYTTACGLYTCWLCLRLATVLYHWVPQGWANIFSKVSDWAMLTVKSLVVAAILIGVVPLLLGLLFELVVVAPLRIPLNQTPVFYPWQDWALGVLHAKIICAMTLMGPQWWLRRVIEQVYNQGLRNMNLTFILTQLCAPVIGCLGITLAAPYIIAKSFVPLCTDDFDTQNVVLRRIYPFLLAIVSLSSFCIFQAAQFRKLYEHIKNDKYLVGQRLVNYERRIRLSVEQARERAAGLDV